MDQPSVPPAIPDNSSKDASTARAGWIKYSDTSNTVIIFVHGFLSNGQTCWANENGQFWPRMVAEDARFKDVSVYVAEYFTSATSYEYGIADCANELYEMLSLPQDETSQPPWKFDNIVFVCHSLGGIVVRYLLCNHYAAISPKRVGVVLMASPSYGSAYADTLAWLSNLFGNKVGSQLRVGGEFLADLDRRFKRLLSQNRSIIGVEGVETKSYFMSRWLQRVVTWDSAGRYFGEPQRIPKADHSLIVKPSDIHQPSHRLLLNFFDREFSEFAKSSAHRKDAFSGPSRSAVAKILFDVFDNSCRDFYFERMLDKRIFEAVDIYAVWVFGPTGTGKTSAVRRYLSETKQRPIEISLSHLNGHLTIDSCIQELAATSAQVDDAPFPEEASIGSIGRSLARRAKLSPVVLYIDEIPISPERLSEASSFIQFVADLLILIKQQAGSNCTVVLSSLERPDFRDNAKLREQMIALEAPSWSYEELLGLYKLIVSKMAVLAVPEKFVSELISEASGSPRFVKTFLRNRYLAGGSLNDETVLAQTKAQYDWRTK